MNLLSHEIDYLPPISSVGVVERLVMEPNATFLRAFHNALKIREAVGTTLRDNIALVSSQQSVVFTPRLWRLLLKRTMIS